MNVLMTGATGLIGTRLTYLLTRNGHRVFRLLRPKAGRGKAPGPHLSGDTEQRLGNAETVDVLWDSQREELAPAMAAAFRGAPTRVEAVINLAGASIAGGRWTESRKQVLRASRIETTRGLVRGLAQLREPPAIFLSASAIGYYGSRGDEILTEESAPGTDFLAKLARDWEAEARKAEEHGTRVVLMRFGIVLARKGGALPQMMRPFRFGLGGKLGSGRQWMSWIEIEDAVCAAHFLLEHEGMRGPVNFVAPEPVTNGRFTKELAKAMKRPALFTVPAAGLRLMLGKEMADALLQSSQRVVPKRLQECGYQFLQPHLDAALHAVLHG